MCSLIDMASCYGHTEKEAKERPQFAIWLVPQLMYCWLNCHGREEGQITCSSARSSINQTTTTKTVRNCIPPCNMVTTVTAVG